MTFLKISSKKLTKGVSKIRKTRLIEINHNNFLYSPFYIEIVVPENVDADFYIKSVLEKEIRDLEEECLYWDVTGNYSYPELGKDFHKISVSTPNNKLVVWVPKEELSYEKFNDYIAESLNLIFTSWNKYEDLYMQLPLDVFVVASSDAEELFKTGKGHGSFRIQDRITGESCWINVYLNEDEINLDFNQYVFSVHDKIDIQARRFQDRIINNNYFDVVCEVEEYIEKIRKE